MNSRATKGGISFSLGEWEKPQTPQGQMFIIKFHPTWQVHLIPAAASEGSYKKYLEKN